MQAARLGKVVHRTLQGFVEMVIAEHDTVIGQQHPIVGDIGQYLLIVMAGINVDEIRFIPSLPKTCCAVCDGSETGIIRSSA